MHATFIPQFNAWQIWGCAFVLVILIEICFKRLYLRAVTSKLPCAWGLPFLGIGYKMIPFYKSLYTFDSLFGKLKTSTYFTWLGKHPIIVTVDPEVIKKVLTSEEYLEKSRMLYAPVDYAVPGNTITSSGPKWKHNRKLLLGALHHKILLNFIPILSKGAKSATEEFDTLVGCGGQKLFEPLKCLILRAALDTIMGDDIPNTKETLVESFVYLLNQIGLDILYATCNLSFIIRNKKYRDTIKYLNEHILKLLNLKYATENNNEELQSADGIRKTCGNFIDQAYRYHKRGLFQTDDVVTQTHTMIAGSFETTTALTYSTLVMLAMHPEVQEKLWEEVRAVYPTKDIQFQYEHIEELPYLGMIIDEVLRLIPSIPLVGRQTVKATQLNDDIMLPKHMQILIPIYTLHRRKDIWGPNADKFNPDNFLPEVVQTRPPYVYIPFSKGVRMCVGWRYAHLAGRIMLIELVRNFKFSTTFKYENLIFRDEISLRYHVEPSLHIERRAV